MADSISTHGIAEQASALPTKRGEIGFDGQQHLGDGDLSSGVEHVMVNDGPHPAERSASPSSSAPSNATQDPILPRRASPSDAQSRTQTPSLARPGKTVAAFRYLRSSQPNKFFGGLSNATVGRMSFILGTMGGVIGLWVLALKIVKSDSSSSSFPDSSSPLPDGQPSITPSIVFLHVAFCLGVLVLLVFFERAVFQARAERFAFLHPGVLPQHRHRRILSSSSRHEGEGSENAARRGMGSGFAFAPWNRPSLPTYAATMNHRGTGDVEDEIIAAPPPPAYGNTRGSTLLMLGVPSLREGAEQQQPVPNSLPPSINRPASWTASLRSYVSSTGGMSDLEVGQGLKSEASTGSVSDDAARAMALGDALAKLEENSASPQSSDSERQR